MRNELINKLNYVKNNLNPNNPSHLQDILYISYLNDSVLNAEDETINLLIQDILSVIFENRLQNETSQNNLLLLDYFMSTRLRRDF